MHLHMTSWGQRLFTRDHSTRQTNSESGIEKILWPILSFWMYIIPCTVKRRTYIYRPSVAAYDQRIYVLSAVTKTTVPARVHLNWIYFCVMTWLMNGDRNHTRAHTHTGSRTNTRDIEWKSQLVRKQARAGVRSICIYHHYYCYHRARCRIVLNKPNIHLAFVWLSVLFEMNYSRAQWQSNILYTSNLCGYMHLYRQQHRVFHINCPHTSHTNYYYYSLFSFIFCCCEVLSKIKKLARFIYIEYTHTSL